MRKVIAVISIICVLIIAGAVLVLSGVIDLKPKAEEKNDIASSEASASIEYMGSYVVIDQNCIAVSTASEDPQLMKITGINIKKLVIGDKVEVDDERGLSYAMKINEYLKAMNIEDNGEIFISSDGSATLYIKKLKVLFGLDKDTSIKLEDLKKFYSEVMDLDGSLDMQEADINNMGYTFKKNQ